MAVTNESVARVNVSQAFPLESPRVEAVPRLVPAKKFNMFSMAVCVGIAVAAFWYVAGFNGKMDAVNYHIDQLQSQISTQTAENASLSTKVNSLKQPSRILQFALNHGEKYANPVSIQASGNQ